MPLEFSPRFGIATVSLGGSQQHALEKKLEAAAKAGFQYIDLMDDCWCAYLKAHGQNETTPWDATDANLALARRLGDKVKSLDMKIACTQPLRVIEGRKDPVQRGEQLELVAKRFPFMRAFDTDLVFMCASVDKEPSSTTDYKTVARDLAEIGRMAEEFSIQDGGPMLRWSSSWEAVRAANRHNVGLIVDFFNMLAVEFADPYNPEGHGMLYSKRKESLDVLRLSLASFVATVPGDRIFLLQIADAALMNPTTFPLPVDPETPSLLPWSRNHRLFPMETERGAYLPLDLCMAALLATGYDGPVSLEVFNRHFHSTDCGIPDECANRGVQSLVRLCQAAMKVEPFWPASAGSSEAYRIWKEGGTHGPRL